MTLPRVVVICLTSLIGLPLAYSVNLFKDYVYDPLVILGIGGTALVVIAALPYLYARHTDIPEKDPFFYAWSLFTFACVIDLIIALENDGVIHSFMAFYLLEGEPYLKTTHGTFINYWDGIGHYSLYIYILTQESYNERYRKAGLYWAGSITNSLLLIFPAGVIGNYGARWPILLNLPYLALPVWMGYKFLKSQPQDKAHADQPLAADRSIWKRPQDMFYIAFFVAATCVHILRASAVLGSPARLAKDYLQQYEPYLTDDVAFPKVQMLLYMFYFVPYYVVAISDLLYPCGQTWVVDWALIFAGAAGQGQFSYMGASLHPDTPMTSQLPAGNHVNIVFWLINGALFLIPHLYAYRCVTMTTGIKNNNPSTVNNGKPVTMDTDDKSISGKDYKPTNNGRYNLHNRQRVEM